MLGDSGLGDEEQEEEEEMLLLLLPPGTRPIRAALAGRACSQQVRYAEKKRTRPSDKQIVFSFCFCTAEKTRRRGKMLEAEQKHNFIAKSVAEKT